LKNASSNRFLSSEEKLVYHTTIVQTMASTNHSEMECGSSLAEGVWASSIPSTTPLTDAITAEEATSKIRALRSLLIRLAASASFLLAHRTQGTEKEGGVCGQWEFLRGFGGDWKRVFKNQTQTRIQTPYPIGIATFSPHQRRL
jgi:hypothetical protein